ncbi:MAG: hypothetical protein KI793_30815 [Rivularia sp. (in: Bacteria)]|nr:hypothetical protein [Rivularia sp. MS3]
MGVASKYWILIEVDSFSRCKSKVLEAAKVFFHEQFPELAEQKEIPDRNIQRQLIQWYQSNDHRGEMAQKCLRCFISNVLKESCIALEQKFSEKHLLFSAELLPLVLDATSSNQDSKSLTTHILSTFNPDKSNLSTWVTVIFKSCSAVKQSLKEHGIVQLTDWTILRYTTHTRLKRVLINVQSTPTQISKAMKLLDGFQSIYCTQLSQYRKPKPDSKFNTAKYPQPTLEQLNQIAEILSKDKEYSFDKKIISAEEVLEELQKLANVLRETWMQSQQTVENNYEKKTSKLPDFCIEPFNNCLHKSVEQVIITRFDYIQRKGTVKGKEQAKRYLEALHLFHCNGMALKKIAVQLGFTDQPHLSRLLKLKILRKDIGRNLILNLKKYVAELAGYSQNPDTLLELDTRIQKMFGQEIDELIEDAEKEAKNGYRLVMNSKLAQSICQFINKFPHFNN